MESSLEVISVMPSSSLVGDYNTAESACDEANSEGSIRRTEHNPLDAWLPITRSRHGNSYTSTSHLLCSGIGLPALLLPAAFTVLGWIWGLVCLSLAFWWQLYTLWLLVHLHESIPGTRYSRYLHLAMAAFGQS
ncbi:hypothetical protein U1Q18_047816 [Sarracenia purpurea var. burkii]